MSEMEAEKFEKAMAAFLGSSQEMINEYYTRNYENLKPSVLSLDPGGRKYIRVVTSSAEGTSRSVWCFVNTENGDILKAKSWKGPAKGARGNIFTPEKYGCSVYGPAYLR